MGRRKRPNYQSIGEIKNDQAIERMAGDPIVQEALDYLANNGTSGAYVDAAVQDAMEYLPNRRAELKLMGGSRTMSDTEAMLDSLATLKGGVPAPIFNTLSNGTERVHVDYDINPVTEQQQIVPVMNPDGSGQVIKTTFGQAGVDRRYEHQAEPVMANAMRLMGYDTINNGNSRRGAADLKGTKNGVDKRVDVMVDFTDNDTVPMPLYTSLVPMDGGEPVLNGSRRGSRVDFVRNQIQEKMRMGLNEYDSVESLVSDGVIGWDDQKRFGKILRGDKASTPDPEDFYDGLIMPGYSDEVLNQPNQPKKVPVPPNSISSVNLVKAFDALKEGRTVGEAKMNMNKGMRGDEYERLQVKPKLARTASSGINDLTQVHPLLQQLLNVDEMKKRIQK